MRNPRLGVAALLLALAAGACRDLPTAAPVNAPTQAARGELRCTVAVRAGSMRCEPARPGGPRAEIILGGQGLNVRLRTTSVSWIDGDNVLVADVAVQNLLDQPLGTDGEGGTQGVRVFFVSGPDVTDGTGQVEAITDSVGTFTASNQKYYVYHEVVQPRGVSSAQTWTFAVPPTATQFEFTVLVETTLPAETSALHFRPERGSPVYQAPLYAVWAASPHDVFAASDGAILHYDGNYWRAMDAGPCNCDPFYDVWGSDGRDVWAVGSGGQAVHWTGGAWEPVDVPAAGGNDLYGLYGFDAEDIYAVGAAGTILHYDGSGWSPVSNGGFTGGVNDVWGINVENVWAVGDDGTVLHSSGGAFSVDTVFAGAFLTAVWAVDDANVWASGAVFSGGGDGGGGAPTGVLYHYDGESWTEVVDPELAAQPLYSGWASGPDDIWVVSGAEVLHWNGGAWARLVVGSGAPVYGVTGTSATNVFAVGEFGTIARSTGGEFATQSISEILPIISLWGSSATDVWGIGGPFIYHRDAGGQWEQSLTPDFEFMSGIWGASASELWAVGQNGTIIHNDGGGWSTVHVDSAITLRAVWGSSASDVWAAGEAGALLHWNGTAWADAAVDAESRSALWGSGPGDLFAVGDGGSITRWNGGGWAPMASGTTVDLYGVWGSGPNDVYAVGDEGTVLHYDGNPEMEWTAVATGAPAGASVFAAWGSGADDVYLLANNGLDLVHWNGASWRTISQLSSNADVWMYTLWGTGPTNLYTAGDAATILHGGR